MRHVEPKTPMSIKKLLFLTDFSTASEAALPFAKSFARQFGAAICAMHVVVPGAYAVPDLANGTIAIQEECAGRDMRNVADQFGDLPHETIVACGSSVWQCVERTIEERGIGLIVLGTHGRTGVSKLLLGSVAEEIFRRSSIPVLTIGPRVPSGLRDGIRFRCVLLATDSSSESKAALRYASSFVSQGFVGRDRASLLLLHIIPEDLHSKDVNESADKAKAWLQSLLASESASGLLTETIIRHGDPSEEILKVATEHQADMIVLGVHGSRKHVDPAIHLEQATAHKVVAQANCPVLTVRSG